MQHPEKRGSCESIDSRSKTSRVTQHMSRWIFTCAQSRPEATQLTYRLVVTALLGLDPGPRRHEDPERRHQRGPSADSSRRSARIKNLAAAAAWSLVDSYRKHAAPHLH